MTNFDNKLNCQDYSIDSLPSIEVLIIILQLTDSLQLNADLAEFKHSYRFNPLSLLPSLGYDLINARPMISISASGVVDYYQNKRVIERKIISIKSKNELQQKNNKIKLVIAFNELKNNILQLKLLRDTYEKHKQYYEIKFQQYKANEINSEVFIKEEINFLEKKKIIITAIDNVNAKFTEIELMLNVKLFSYLTYDN